MIVTVTLNAALDVTYGIDRLVPHSSHRICTVHQQAGGKGINVARVLAAFDRHALVMGLVGGATGDAIRAEIASFSPSDLVDIAAESRRTLTVVCRADGEATTFNEPGPMVTAEEWSRFSRRFAESLDSAKLVVLSGSLPPGLPISAYAELVQLAHEHEVPAVVDVGGEALMAAARARPAAVKPNLSELTEATGSTDPMEGAYELRAVGAQRVVVSQGASGLLAVGDDGTWRAVPPARVSGNPTGAGDACVAALAVGLTSRWSWPKTLRVATALSAAAVCAPVAGRYDAAAYRRFLPAVHVEELDATHADR